MISRVANGDGVTIPDLLPVRGEVRINDPNRMVIRMTDETVLKGIDSTPLFAGFAGLAALLLAISAMWWREGR